MDPEDMAEHSTTPGTPNETERGPIASGGSSAPDAAADEDRPDEGSSAGSGPAAPGDAPSGDTIGATHESKDPALEKDPEDWTSGDDPMTESQRSYLDTLAKRAGEELPADLTKAQASEHIDRLRQRLG